MKVVIFGALGDIGSATVPLALELGHEVTAVDLREAPDHILALGKTNQRFRYLQGDAQSFETVIKVMKESSCEGVVNLAGVRNPSDYLVNTHNTNVVISWNVLRAAAELGIKRVSQASSINITGAIFNKVENLKPVYFPLDEDHPCTPDEPYGLSKQIMELQADAIVRRYPSMRVTSIRTHWAIPPDQYCKAWKPSDSNARHFWGYTNLRSCARAFLLGLAADEACFQNGHEACFVVSPIIASDEKTETLLSARWPDVPLKRELTGTEGLYDCSKAKRILGWAHEDED